MGTPICPLDPAKLDPGAVKERKGPELVFPILGTPARMGLRAVKERKGPELVKNVTKWTVKFENGVRKKRNWQFFVSGLAICWKSPPEQSESSWKDQVHGDDKKIPGSEYCGGTKLHHQHCDRSTYLYVYCT